MRVVSLRLRFELMLFFGSLPRPPDVDSQEVCVCILHLLSTTVHSRTLFVVDDLAFWRYLAHSYALSEGELRFRFSLFANSMIDYFELLLIYDAGSFDLLLSSPIALVWASLLMLLHYCCARSFVATQGCVTATSPSQSQDYGFIGRLKMFQTMEITSDQCYFFWDHYCHTEVTSQVSTPMRRMKRTLQSFVVMDHFLTWFVMFLSRMKRETSSFSRGLGYSKRNDSYMSMFNVRAGWFRFILEFIYWSLPRPPERMIYGWFVVPAPCLSGSDFKAYASKNTEAMSITLLLSSLLQSRLQRCFAYPLAYGLSHFLV